MHQPLGKIDTSWDRTWKHPSDTNIEYAGDEQRPTCETIDAIPDRFVGERFEGSDTDPFLRRDEVENERDGQDKNNDGWDYKRLVKHWFTSFQ